MLFIFIYFMRADFKGCLRYHRRNTGRKIFLHSAITSSKAPEALLNKTQTEENHTRMWIKQKHIKVCQLNPHMHHMSTFALWEKKYLMHISVKRKKNHQEDRRPCCLIAKSLYFFLVFKYGPLSAGSSKKHGHTTHNSHQSLSIFRWDFSFCLDWGGGVPISSFHV